MTIEQVKAQILAETNLKVTVKNGKGSMKGYTCFSINKNQKFDFNWRKNFIKQFPVCDIYPAMSSEISIMVCHGIER